MKGVIVSTTKRLRLAAAVNAPLSSKRTMPTATAAAITTTAAATATAFVSIEKIIARVFCPPQDLTLSTPAAADIDPSSKNTNDADGVGGNPVTVFIIVVPSSPRHSDNTSMTIIPKSIQRRLARTCQWESVFVTITKPNNNHNNNNASSSSTSILPPPTMNFFMPSAEEVSFCAHAAIGGAAATVGVVNGTNTLRNKTITLENNKNNNITQFQAAMTGESFVVDIIHDNNNNNNNNANNTKKKENKNCGTTCRLSMTNVRYQEQDLSLDGKRMLQEWCTKLDWSLSSSLLLSSASALKNQQKPSRSRRSCRGPRNASVARIKTLVPLRSVDAVHRAIPPPLPDIICTTTTDNNSPYYSLSATRTKPNNTNNNNKNNNIFSDACDSMDGSSGIYVYAPIYTDDDDAPSSSAITTCRSIKSSNNNANNVVTCSYECRQFPRSSGYQEDPATGIAAAALAASLHFENDDDTTTTTTTNNNNNNNSDASHHHNLYTTSFTGITSSTGSNNSNNNISSSGSDKTIVYNIHQGTTMGRPLLIQVVDLQKYDATADNDTDGKNNNNNNNKSDISTSNSTDDTKDFRISFGLQGTVEIDDHCTIEVAIP